MLFIVDGLGDDQDVRGSVDRVKLSFPEKKRAKRIPWT
jgi:hypothetical protein